MAATALEVRFKHLSVYDENDEHDGTNSHQNSKATTTGTRPSDRTRPPESSKSAVYKQPCTIIDLVTQEKDGKSLRRTRKPLSVISTQKPDEVTKTEEYHIIGIKQQITAFKHVASQVPQAKDGQTPSRARHPLSVVMSQTPDAASDTEEHRAGDVKRPSTIANHVSSQVTQAEGGQALSARNTLSVAMSETSNAVKTGERSVPLIK